MDERNVKNYGKLNWNQVEVGLPYIYSIYIYSVNICRHTVFQVLWRHHCWGQYTEAGGLLWATCLQRGEGVYILVSRDSSLL